MKGGGGEEEEEEKRVLPSRNVLLHPDQNSATEGMISGMKSFGKHLNITALTYFKMLNFSFSHSPFSSQKVLV